MTEPAVVTRRELSAAYHDCPHRTTVENGRTHSWHDGVEAVARLVAERAGIELVIDREQSDAVIVLR